MNLWMNEFKGQMNYIGEDLVTLIGMKIPNDVTSLLFRKILLSKFLLSTTWNKRVNTALLENSVQADKDIYWTFLLRAMVLKV